MSSQLVMMPCSMGYFRVSVRRRCARAPLLPLLRLAAVAASAAAALLACLAAGAPQAPPPLLLAQRQRPVQPTTSTTPLPDNVQQSSWAPCECAQGPCVCVMYYLCNLATNSVYIYGEDVLDERFGGDDKVASCPTILEHCCRIPPKEETEVGGVAVRPPLPSGPVVGGPDPQPPVGPPVGPPAPTPSQPPHVNVNPPREGDVSTRWECGVRRTDFALLDTWARVDDKESDEVSFAEFPWTLVVIQNADDKWLGGASLVSPRLALTAAHSVHGDKLTNNRPLNPEELRVRAGEWDAASRDEPLAHQERQVSQVVVHPRFTRRALLHDAALLVLEVPFDAALHVAPICLPPYGASFDGRRCIATGWGTDAPGKNGALRQLLRRVELPVVPRDECQERLRTTRLGVFYHLHDSFMCAGAENGKDTCKGDGGGPLVCQSSHDPRRYEQAGIVSWGIGCSDPNIPSVYTDVAKMRPWLDEQMQLLDPQSR